MKFCILLEILANGIRPTSKRINVSFILMSFSVLCYTVSLILKGTLYYLGLSPGNKGLDSLRHCLVQNDDFVKFPFSSLYKALK